jgi:DNA-binding CsgD family transcriptional regulator
MHVSRDRGGLTGFDVVIEPRFTSVLAARNREELRDEVVRFASHLGFDTVSAMTVIDRPSGATEFITVDNMPEGYRGIFDNPANFGSDPVMQHCKARGVPIVWDQSTYVRSRQSARWESQAEYGLRFGIAMALHLPQGRHFFVGVDRDQDLPSCPVELSRMVSELSLFAVHANEVSSALLAPDSKESAVCVLTAREREVLRWTLEGKTAWEVGMILRISARTAAIHANNAAHKFGCVSKHQAALRALHCGLL